MRGKRFKAGTRREEEENPHGSLTDEQRGRSLKDLPPFGLRFCRAAGSVASQSQSAMAMFLRRALSAARQTSAHSFLFMRWVL